tara:strand:- start:226 stop:456 length:231 start_codon:yes stop_codon:yes gene_type:complete
MVLSTTKRTSSISSIVNKNQGGGNKKAGFPYIVGRDSASSLAMKGTSQNLKVLQFTVNPFVRQSRPVHIRPSEYKP